MNICVVSTFDGTTEDFMEIFNWAKDKASTFATDFEVGVIREGKVITMANVTDMEKFQEIIKKSKNLYEVYSKFLKKCYKVQYI